MKTKQIICIAAMVGASLSSALGSVYTAPYSDTADTVALWHMESIRSDKYIDDDDSVVIDRNATLQLAPNPVSTSGGPTVVTPSVYPAGNSAFGNALHLDGVDDFGAIANAGLSITPAGLRIESWVKSDAAVSGQYIFDRWGQILVFSDAAGFKVRVYDSTTVAFQDISATPSGFNATDWNHFAVEVNGGDVGVYVNGDLAASATLTGGLSTVTSKTTTYIGQRYNATGRFAGYLDEFRISTIPEPATLSLVGIAAVGIFVRRRLRK